MKKFLELVALFLSNRTKTLGKLIPEESFRVMQRHKMPN